MKTEFWVTNFAAPGRAGRIAKLYEDAGWDGLLFTDSQHHNGDVYQSLALASVATKRIGLGTGVTNPLTRNAAVTAAAILSVQVESNGRAIILGIGRGDSSLGHLGLGPAPVNVLEDYVAKVQGYLRGEAVVQNNHAAHLKWIEGIPKPPVDIAATGPRVSAVAGRVTDMPAPSPERPPPGGKARGRPGRERSSSPGKRSWKNRFRHWLTTSRRVLSRAAISSFCSPCAAKRTIRAR